MTGYNVKFVTLIAGRVLSGAADENPIKLLVEDRLGLLSQLVIGDLMVGPIGSEPMKVEEQFGLSNKSSNLVVAGDVGVATFP